MNISLKFKKNYIKKIYSKENGQFLDNLFPLNIEGIYSNSTSEEVVEIEPTYRELSEFETFTKPKVLTGEFQTQSYDDKTQEFVINDNLEMMRQSKLNNLQQELKEKLSIVYLGGFTTSINSIKMDCTEESYSKYEKGILAADLMKLENMQVVDFNNEKHLLTIAECKQIQIDLLQRLQVLYWFSRDTKDLILTCKSVEDLSDINIDNLIAALDDK